MLGQGFDGVRYTNLIPPDPTIAAGPNNIVVVVNATLAVYTKSGTLQSSQSLTALTGAVDFIFDPWAVYDPYINRFWILAEAANDNPNRSTQYIALSNTSDANDGFNVFTFDATVNGGTTTSNWCDHAKLGYDAQAIYVTCNQFAFPFRPQPGPPPVPTGPFQYVHLRVMTKDQFVNRTCCLWWDFWDLRDPAGGTAKSFTVQPARMYGAAVADGEFLVNAQGNGGSGSALEVRRVTNAQRCCIQNQQSAPDVAQHTQNVGSYAVPPGAVQQGSTVVIDTGDTRLQYAIWQAGRLTTGQDLSCGSQACVAITEVDVSAYPTMTNINDWTLNAAGFDYYYPAVDINATGNRTMVFSRSSSSEFASAHYVGVPPSSVCTGCFDAEAQLQEGQNTYVNCASNCTPPTPTPAPQNRWGDYMGASTDPDGVGIWIHGEYAAATANQWTSRVGLTYENGPPANDDFQNAVVVAALSVPTQRTTTTTSATTELNEPTSFPTGACASSSRTVGKSAWYRVLAPEFAVPLVIDTLGSSFDTIMAVYTGSSVGGLTRVACNDDLGGGSLQSRVSFTAAANTIYQIQVGGFSGLLGASSGNLVVNFGATPPANDNFAAASDIAPGAVPVQRTAVTLGASTEAGEPQTFPAGACASTGSNIDKTVWYTFTPTSAFSLTLDTIGSSFDTILAVYTGNSVGGLTRVACNDDLGGGSLQSRVSFTAAAGTTYRIQVGGLNGASGNAVLNVTGAPVPTSTPTPTATRTPTSTPTPTATPFPRPNVGVGATPNPGTHTLQAVITARDAGCSANNQLQSLRFTRLTNATVDVPTSPGTTVTTAPMTVALPSLPASITITVHRVIDGQATTVELVVTDGCGDWPTLVGGGPSAF